MLTDVGVKFSMAGAADAISQMKNLHGGFTGLSSEVGRSASSIKNHLETISSATSKMANAIHSSMNIAKVAFGAFVTGKALSGIGHMLGGPGTEPGAGFGEDYFRMAGGNVKKLKESIVELRKTFPRMGYKEYEQAGYGMVGALGTTDPKLVHEGMRSLAHMQTALGPDASAMDAYKILRSISQSYGAEKSPEGRLEIFKEVEKMIPTVLNEGAAFGHELALALSHVVGIAKEKGLKISQIGADLSATASVLGERAGEVQKNVYMKLPHGMGEIAAEIGKEQKFARLGVRRIEELSPEQAAHLMDSVKETQTHWTRLASQWDRDRDPRIWHTLKGMLETGKGLQISRGFDLMRVISQAFGETSPQALGLMADRNISGWISNLEKKINEINVDQQRKEQVSAMQSYEHKKTELDTAALDLSLAIHKPFKLALGDLYEDYAKTLQKMRLIWEEHGQSIQTNVRAVFDGMRQGFVGAFHGAKDLEDVMKRIAEHVGKPDAEGWNQWGKFIGDTIGSAFRDVLPTLKSIEMSLSTIATAIAGIGIAANIALLPFRELAGLTDSVLKRTLSRDFKNELIDAATKDAYERGKLSKEEYDSYAARRRLPLTPEQELAPPTALSGAQQFAPAPVPYDKSYLGKLDDWFFGLFQSPTPAPTAAPHVAPARQPEATPYAAPALAPTAAPIDKSYLEKLEQWFLGLFQKMSSESSGSDKPEIKLTCNVTLGNKELRDVVADVVEEFEANRSANYRQAAGDAGFARPWLG